VLVRFYHVASYGLFPHESRGHRRQLRAARRGRFAVRPHASQDGVPAGGGADDLTMQGNGEVSVRELETLFADLHLEFRHYPDAQFEALRW